MLQLSLHPQLKKILCATTKTWNSQINTFFKKLNIHLSKYELAIDGSVGKESNLQCRRYRWRGFNPWVRKITGRRKWQPTPVFLPGKFHRQRSLAGYSPWGHEESDMPEQLTSSLLLETNITLYVNYISFFFKKLKLCQELPPTN